MLSGLKIKGSLVNENGTAKPVYLSILISLSLSYLKVEISILVNQSFERIVLK